MLRRRMRLARDVPGRELPAPKPRAAACRCRPTAPGSGPSPTQPATSQLERVADSITATAGDLPAQLRQGRGVECSDGVFGQAAAQRLR